MSIGTNTSTTIKIPHQNPLPKFSGGTTGSEMVLKLNELSQEVEDLKSIVLDLVGIVAKVDATILERVKGFERLGTDGN